MRIEGLWAWNAKEEWWSASKSQAMGIVCCCAISTARRYLDPSVTGGRRVCRCERVGMNQEDRKRLVNVPFRMIHSCCDLQVSIGGQEVKERRRTRAQE